MVLPVYARQNILKVLNGKMGVSYKQPEGIVITGNLVSPADVRFQDPSVAEFEAAMKMKNQPPPGGGS
jgi:hypothetical protein